MKIRTKTVQLLIIRAVVGITFLQGSTLHGAGDQAGILTLDEYLNQVKAANRDLAVQRATSKASEGKSAESELILAPTVFASVQRADDRKPESNPFQGSRAEMLGASVGVSKVTNFGLAGKISYGMNRVELTGSNPMFVAESKYFEAKPTIELSQSLWKNGGGREVNATRELISSQTEVIKQTEQFKGDMKLMEAEMSFWRLVLARESVRTTKESLSRAQKLRDWTADKVKQQLADKADLLQTEAAFRGRKLEQQMAEDEERSAGRALNALRGNSAGGEVEKVVQLTAETLARHPSPVRKPGDSRADTQAAMAATKIAEANLIIQNEKHKPQLDLFASATLNGKDEGFGQANKEAISAKYPTTVIGIKLSAPIGAESISKQRAAALAESGVSSLNVDAKKYTEEREWAALAASLEESRSRVSLANEIAAIQKQRSATESERHKTGRTTMFQVLMAEQDLAQSELNLIRSQADMLRTIAQMKSFHVTSGEVK